MDYSDRFNGVIKLGDHLVLLYDSESSITDTVVAYISNSLLNNQKFIYITGDTDVKMIQEKLKELELFNSYVDSRQLVFLNQSEAYSKEGRFNPERMKELLKTLTMEAQTDGFEGLAISGEISWVLEYDKGFDLINEYEWKINSEVFGVFPVTALCRYNMDRFSDEMIINVIQLHPFLILKNKVYENPFYIPAIAYETNNIPKYQVKTWLENIVKFSNTKSEFNQRLKEKDLKVFEFKNLLEASLESFEDIIVFSGDRNYEYLYFNGLHKNNMKKLYNVDIEIGDNILDYVTEGIHRDKAKRNYDLALSGQSFTIVEEYGDDQRIFFESSFSPIYSSNNDIMGVAILTRDITMKNMEQLALKESEERYRLLNDHLPFGLCHLQVIPNVKEKKNEYYYLSVNHMFEKQVGMKNADFIGKTILDVFPNTEQYWMDSYDSVVATGNPVTFEEYSIELDRYMKISAYMMGFNQMAVLVEDITTRIEAEQSLKELMFQTSIEKTEKAIVFSLDKEYKYTYFNELHCQEMKNIYNAEIEIGHSIFDYMSSNNDIARIKPTYDRVLSGESYKEIQEYGDVEKNYYESNFDPIFDPNGDVIGLKVFIENISEKIKMQNKIKLTEENLRKAQRLGKIGSFELDLETRVLWASEQAYETYHLKRTDGLMDESTAIDLIIEEDREIMTKALEELIESGKPYDVVVRIKTMLGEIKYVNSRGYLEVDKNDKPVKVIGTTQDITELREKEIELEKMAFTDYLTGLSNRRKFEEKLIELNVAENLPITIVMADINGLKLINDAFGHLSGDELLKSAAELIFSKCRDTDIVARIGGDEFAIIMVKTNTTSAEKIIKAVNIKAKGIMTQSIPLSISFGFKAKTHEDDNIYEVLRSAEDLMYREKLLEIPSMRSGAIETILNTLYEKDIQSEVHSRTVSDLSERLAKAYGMDRQDVAEVKTAGLLHDIGKIIVSLSIINKKGKLTKEEYSTMKNHPEIGFRILNSSQDMRGISNIVLNHHERWDGGGYPRGIKAEEIPLKSRIISIADAFDAMTSERNYKETMSKEEALQELLDNAGTQFDPELVKIFKENFIEITK